MVTSFFVRPTAPRADSFAINTSRPTCWRKEGPEGLANELRGWKAESRKSWVREVAPDAFIFPNADGGFIDVGSFRNRGLTPLAKQLGIPKLNFQVLWRTMATQAQKMGSVKDIQLHLQRSRPDTTAHEYMQELPESVIEW